MNLDAIYLGIIALGFVVISVALAGKFIVEAYCEYIQVREGIRVMTQRELEAMMEEDEDDETFS